MARVSTYLNFMGQAEEAFTFYKSVFGTDFETPITKMADVPMDPDGPALAAGEESLVMHAALPITAGHVLMATDMVPSMGHQLRVGNNTTIHLEVDDRAEADRLYGLLGEGSTECSPMQQMFWGAYWGTCLDRFGIRWMISAPAA